MIPGRLKVVIVRRDLCVGYAGRADAAVDAIRHVHHDQLDFHDAVRLLSKHTEGGDVDFIAAGGEQRAVVRISSGRSSNVHEQDFVGDEDAIEVYSNRSIIRPLPGTDPDIARLGAASSALQDVIDDTRIESVGGLAIRAAMHPDGFRYIFQAVVNMPTQVVKAGTTAVLNFGDAAAGGFGYTMLTPDAPGIGLIAVHMHQGGLCLCASR